MAIYKKVYCSYIPINDFRICRSLLQVKNLAYQQATCPAKHLHILIALKRFFSVNMKLVLNRQKSTFAYISFLITYSLFRLCIALNSIVE